MLCECNLAGEPEISEVMAHCGTSAAQRRLPEQSYGVVRRPPRVL
jgi:hypothetical protein